MSGTPYDADIWVEVSSSLITAVGTRGDDLIVQFKGGKCYRYPKTAFEFDSLTHAESVGKYFHANVRSLPSQRLGIDWPDE